MEQGAIEEDTQGIHFWRAVQEQQVNPAIFGILVILNFAIFGILHQKYFAIFGIISNFALEQINTTIWNASFSKGRYTNRCWHGNRQVLANRLC